MTTESRCGGCTVCCNRTAVPELKKPVWQTCQHCNVGVGCKIYPTRPPSCQKFECAWYKDTTLSYRLRPDRCGVMVEEVEGTPLLLAMVDNNRPGAWKMPIITEWFAKFLAKGRPVITTDGINPPNILVPPGQSANRIWNTAQHLARRAAQLISEK